MKIYYYAEVGALYIELRPLSPVTAENRGQKTLLLIMALMGN